MCKCSKATVRVLAMKKGSTGSALPHLFLSEMLKSYNVTTDLFKNASF